MAKLNIQQETFDNYVKENIEDLGKFQHFNPHAVRKDSKINLSNFPDKMLQPKSSLISPISRLIVVK